MSLLHCMPTAQPSKVDTFLWRLFELFTLSFECWCCLYADTTSADLFTLFLLFWSFSVSSLFLLELVRCHNPGKARGRVENKGGKCSTLGSQEKAVEQILSQQRAQMRYLTKGNNYLSNEANPKLSNKNKLHCES